MSFGTLTIVYADGRQETVHLSKPTVHLGHADDNDVVLADSNVDQYHAQILCSTGGCQILDLGSTNGTLLAGMPVTAQVPQPLHDRAVIQLGNMTLIYRSPKAVAPHAALPAGVTTMLPTEAAAAAPSHPSPTRASAGRQQSAQTARLATASGDDSDRTTILTTAQAQSGAAAASRGDDASEETTFLNAASPQPPSSDEQPARRWTEQPPSRTPPPNRSRRTPLLIGGGLLALLLLAVVSFGLFRWFSPITNSNDDPPVVAEPEITPTAAEPGIGGASPVAAPTPTMATATEEPAPTPTSPPGRPCVVVAVNSPLNVRSTPGTAGGTATVIGTLPYGTEVRVVEGPVRVLEDNYGWVRIEADDLSGWVAQEFLDCAQ